MHSADLSYDYSGHNFGHSYGDGPSLHGSEQGNSYRNSFRNERQFNDGSDYDQREYPPYGNEGVHGNQNSDDYDSRFISGDDPRSGPPHSYLSSPYGSDMGALNNQIQRGPPDNRLSSRNPPDSESGYPMSYPQPPPNYSVNPRNGYRSDDPYNDQISSVGEDVNPLDERFSEQSSELGGPVSRYRGAPDLPVIREADSRLGNWPQSTVQRDDSYLDHGPLVSRPLHSPFVQTGIPENNYTQPQINGGLSRTQSQSMQQSAIDSKWRNPDLQEVIDFLSHHRDAVKANAAAYLQHLSYMDDNIKVQTRVLRGIPPLVELVNHTLPEVHRSACGALRNLSYGRANDENKREIKNVGGITTLVRLLRKTAENDIQELVTGILWNLSSCMDVKKSIIDESVKMIVDTVVIPLSGWDRNSGIPTQPGVYRSIVFRNASGVLRNVSSDGPYARKKLRECEGLVESLILIVRSAISINDFDHKSIENCVCILRNLSYACQEVTDPDYIRKKKKVPTATLR